MTSLKTSSCHGTIIAITHGATGCHHDSSVFSNIEVWRLKYDQDFQINFLGKGPTDKESALVQVMAWCQTGGRLNKKDSLTRYGDSHVKDKTS